MSNQEPSSAQLAAKAENERRLGLLILENKEGPELASAASHLRNASELFAKGGWADRQAECLLHLGRLQTKRNVAAEAAEAFTTALRQFTKSHDIPQAIQAATGSAEAHRRTGRGTLLGPSEGRQVPCRTLRPAWPCRPGRPLASEVQEHAPDGRVRQHPTAHASKSAGCPVRHRRWWPAMAAR